MLAIILDNRTDHYAAQMAVTQVDTTGSTGQLLDNVTSVLASEGVSTFERAHCRSRMGSWRWRSPSALRHYAP